jgi:hypothetical protein
MILTPCHCGPGGVNFWRIELEVKQWQRRESFKTVGAARLKLLKQKRFIPIFSRNLNSQFSILSSKMKKGEF